MCVGLREGLAGYRTSTVTVLLSVGVLRNASYVLWNVQEICENCANKKVEQVGKKSQSHTHQKSQNENRNTHILGKGRTKENPESMTVWMKIALDGTHLYAGRPEYCHYVAAIAFRQIGFRRPAHIAALQPRNTLLPVLSCAMRRQFTENLLLASIERPRCSYWTTSVFRLLTDAKS